LTNVLGHVTLYKQVRPLVRLAFNSYFNQKELIMNNLKLVNGPTSKIKSHIVEVTREYKNDISFFKAGRVATMHAAGYVAFEDIDTFGDHQTRVKDLDRNHVEDLKNQIISNGLSKIPYVEWNTQDQNYTILSGHHRIQAFHDMNVQEHGKDEATSFIPVCVVEFFDDYEKELFLQRENTSHEAQKNHNHSDAMAFLRKLRSMNHNSWNSLFQAGDYEAVRKQAYKELDNAGYSLHGPSKKKVFEGAFESELKLDTLRTITTSESTKNSTHLWQVSKTDQWLDNKYVIAGNDDASTKSLKIATRKRLKYVKKNALFGKIPLGSIKMYIHFLSVKDFGALQAKRLRFLDTIADENCFDYCNSNYNLVVDEVVFAPQFKSGDGKIKETMEIRFVWDIQKKTFVLSSNNSKTYQQVLKLPASKAKNSKVSKKKDEESLDFLEAFDISTSPIINYESDKYYKKQLQLYNMIADKVGFTPRKFPTKTVFFKLSEAKAIALKINPDFDFSGKTVCGSKNSIFRNVVNGWKHQDTTATHPNLENMESIYNSL